MKIKMTLELPADNGIQMYDVCKAAADMLDEIGAQALREGDNEALRGKVFDVVTEVDEPETVGQIKVTR